ncbi:glycosyltransferase involved in cell wall biosynthesis [Novosphingobium sp. 1529]|uniref:glycosyltransferase family 2 protein n=1 Tax=Novosphingobium sp. 1529 TaxID=3156424 RepID=UPI00339992B5
MQSATPHCAKRKVAFSIVVPLYNKRDLISETIAGALLQTHRDFELIVIDDGSTDGSGEIVATFDDPRIRLIRQKNQGAAAARNSGWLTAHNPFVAFLDGDDQWDTDYLATLAELISDFPNCGAYATGYRRQAPAGQTIQNRLEPSLAQSGRCVIPDYFLSAARGDQPFYTSSVCLRHDAIGKLGGFRSGVTHGEDLDLWARLALEYPIAFDPTPKVTYRMDASNRAMHKCPPFGWIFRDYARQFRTEHPHAQLSPALDLNIQHIELFHASLNLFSSPGRDVRNALRRINWSSYPLRKGKIWAMSFLPQTVGRWLLTRLRG